MSIILVGFMAAGKSSVGKMLSKLSSVPFIDTDPYLEARQGRSISDIFAEDGEAYFRKLETEIVENLVNFDEVIIATGGGMPCHSDNMTKLKDIGSTIYLQVPAELLIDRLIADKFSRPLVAQKTASEIRTLVEKRLEDRESTYLRANYTFAVSEKVSIEEIAREILWNRQMNRL